MKKIICTICALITFVSVQAQNKYDNPDTLVVSRDGTGQFRNISEAILGATRSIICHHPGMPLNKDDPKEWWQSGR